MSPRITLALLVCSSLMACGAPEPRRIRSSGTAGSTGSPGTGGSTGAAGSTGVAGDASQGVAGNIGVAGDPAGVAGATGQAGDPGGAGSTGQAGSTGNAGATGQAGVGAAGATGQAGSTGQAGAGAAGATGQAGAGAAGATGQAGAGATAGSSGAAGSGAAGATGGTFGAGPVLRIEAGGTAMAGMYVPDEFFTPTPGQTTTHANTIDTTGVTNPAPDAVYQSSRQGTFTYTLTGYTASSSHTMRLHFCETYFPPAGDPMPTVLAGRRLCNISVNGTVVLMNYDILAKTGAKNKAIAETLTANASASGQVVVGFTPTKDNCFLAGIEIQ